jgi:hypothetical protein
VKKKKPTKKQRAAKLVLARKHAKLHHEAMHGRVRK